MIDDYPVDWTASHVQETLRILESIYRQSEIERIVEDAGLRPARVAWNDEPALTWRSVFKLAAENLAVPALLDTVANEKPTLNVRMQELRAPTGPVVSTRLPASDPGWLAFDSPGWKNFSADGQAEAIIVAGQPTFVDVSFLARGVDRARSVCRLKVHFPESMVGSGTGFRVGPQHLLTNHHVLFDRGRGDREFVKAEAWFNYETDEQGYPKATTKISCDPESVVGEKADDWALIRTVEQIPADFPPLALFGARAPERNDRVYIIQHPNGEPKKVAFQHNVVRNVTDDRIQYWTDTDLGSSGSPVFDEAWNLVGLHHMSVRAPGDNPSNVRNQGRRIDRVVERMKSANINLETWA